MRLDGDCLTICASGIRGWIYGIGMFLRKTVYKDGQIFLLHDPTGEYTPAKKIRGHQLGFRVCSNTYDAWTTEQYTRYYLDLMYFGMNTVEHIPGGKSPGRNALMQQSPDELCFDACAAADALDLDVSLWFPNDDLPLEQSVALRSQFFAQCPRIDALFIPGGDPGNYPADVFIQRVLAIGRALHAAKPDAQLWPSAQAPHSIPDWGEAFMEQVESLSGEIDGVIYGPNHAFPLDELRRRLPARFPIRFYPDITHNVRCEYPVHFAHEDWHFAFASTLSRESINPRPEEFRLLHRLTRNAVIGSVSYSEGVNDDVNKCVWSDMDFDPQRELYDSLLDYARLFLWHAPARAIADGILALERGWIGDPANNPQIEQTLQHFERLARDYPALLEQWRFVQLLFRARCDALVRRRRIFELDLLRNARGEMARNNLQNAMDILQTPFSDSYSALRQQIEFNAQTLFRQIGMQLGTKDLYASQWERGATLDTLDQPITDRAFYLTKLRHALELPADAQRAFVRGLLARNSVLPDEMYYSFAEHGLQALGVRQTPEYYMDFQGDDPAVNNGTMPMCQLMLFDHFSCRFKISGCLPDTQYCLRISYSAHTRENVTKHTIRVNGNVLYCGPQYGGRRDEKFDADYLAPGTQTATYPIPSEWLQNGCAEVVIEEPTVGVKLSEFWVLRAENIREFA